MISSNEAIITKNIYTKLCLIKSRRLLTVNKPCKKVASFVVFVEF